MKVVVPIKDLRTGEVRIHLDDGGGEAATIEFMWDDGNYSCDCNRNLFFERVAVPDYDGEHECGNVRYGVEWIEVDGVRITLPEEALRRAWDAEQAEKAAP